MSNPAVPAAKFSIATPAELAAVRALVERIGGDGHTIWDKEVLSQFPLEIRARFSRTHLSAVDDYKKTIFNRNDVALDQLAGVNGLEVLEALAADLGVSFRGAHGRGTRARRATAALNEFLASR